MIPCIVTSPIHAHGIRYEIGASVDLEPDEYDRFRKHSCVVTREEREAEAAAKAEADRFVEEVRVSAEKTRAEHIEKARAAAVGIRAAAEAKALEEAPPKHESAQQKRRPGAPLR